MIELHLLLGLLLSPFFNSRVSVCVVVLFPFLIGFAV